MKRKYTFSQQIVSQLELILFSVGREMAHKKPWMHRHVSLHTTSTWVVSTTRIRSKMSTVFLLNRGAGTVTWRSFFLKRPWWTHTFYGSFHQIMEPSHSSIFAWNWSMNYSAIIHVAKGKELRPRLKRGTESHIFPSMWLWTPVLIAHQEAKGTVQAGDALRVL